MLKPSELDYYLRKGRGMADAEVQKAAESWDLGGWHISPQLIATVYSYMKNKYRGDETLIDIERCTGICRDSISMGLKALEAHGYITISRTKKPYIYAVVK